MKAQSYGGWAGGRNSAGSGWRDGPSAMAACAFRVRAPIRPLEGINRDYAKTCRCACVRKLPHIFDLDFTNKILAGAPEAGRRATVAV